MEQNEGHKEKKNSKIKSRQIGNIVDFYAYAIETKSYKRASNSKRFLFFIFVDFNPITCVNDLFFFLIIYYIHSKVISKIRYVDLRKR